MSREADPEATLARNPWWIPRLFGRVPVLEEAHIRLLGVVALALVFESFDQATLTAALKQISEEFGVQESDLGAMLGRVHLGAIPAFLLLPFADRLGRRRLFLVSVLGLSLATFASAFSTSIDQFVVLQMIGRAFMVTCSATAFVILTEEFPAAHRGWGIGILGALGNLGYGLALMLFAGIEWLPYGWRALYVLGVVPILLLPMFRREVRETGRFESHRLERSRRGESADWSGWWRPLAGLVRAYPWRTLAVGAIGALASAGHSVGFNFSAYFVQVEHGWSPANYTAMAVSAGLVGIVGQPWAGRFADRRGRKRVGSFLLCAYPALALAFYHGPGWLLPFLWIPLIFTLTGGDTIVRALGAELFPTSQRSTAAGWLKLWEAGGRSAGLFAIAWGTPDGASNVPMISLLVLAPLVAGLVVLGVPETRRRELEEVSGER